MNLWMMAVAYAMITLFLGFILKEMGFHGSRLVVILGTVAAVGIGVSVISEIMKSFSVFGQDIENSQLKLMLKILGVGYVSGICSDICIDLGEGGLAGTILQIGRLEMLLVCTPTIISIIEKGAELII